MTRTRQIVLATSLFVLAAAATFVFWAPSQKTDLMIAPASGPAR